MAAVFCMVVGVTMPHRLVSASAHARNVVTVAVITKATAATLLQLSAQTTATEAVRFLAAGVIMTHKHASAILCAPRLATAAMITLCSAILL